MASLRKPSPPPNLDNFPKTTSPSSKTFCQSKTQPRMNPITPWLSKKWQGKAKITINPRKTHVNDNK